MNNERNFEVISKKILFCILAALILLDIVGMVPLLDGLSYYLFNTAYGMGSELFVWLCISLIGCSYLIKEKNFPTRLLILASGIVAILISGIILYKLYQTLIYVFSGGDLYLAHSNSVYSYSIGRIFGLVILFFLIMPAALRKCEK